MKITALAITPNSSIDQTKNFPMTHELLAASAARFSRSNLGIEDIYSKIDWSDVQKSTKSIFDMADYGHASIRGLSGHIPVAIEGISMRLAYELFHIAQQADGQESSTRYIDLSGSWKDRVPDIDSLFSFNNRGAMPRKELIALIEDLYSYGFEMYEYALHFYSQQLEHNPDLVQYPENCGEKKKERLRRNYAFDRARYYLPFVTKTNVILNMTAGAWGTCLSYISSFNIPEFQTVAERIREQLQIFVPGLLKHANVTEEHKAHIQRNYFGVSQGLGADLSSGYITSTEPSHITLWDRSSLSQLSGFERRHVAGTRYNRYDHHYFAIKEATFKFSIQGITLAELRDLNRHRTGYRRSNMFHLGFFVPEELQTGYHLQFMNRYENTLAAVVYYIDSQCIPNLYFLGTQTSFSHTLQLDKLIYEIELRTGPGSHFKYAEHMREIYDQLVVMHPFLENVIQLGTAEPE